MSLHRRLQGQGKEREAVADRRPVSAPGPSVVRGVRDTLPGVGVGVCKGSPGEGAETDGAGDFAAVPRVFGVPPGRKDTPADAQMMSE